MLKVIEKEKEEHHDILVCAFQFLSLPSILKLGRVNRKLYIVSGDISMLRKNYMKSNQGIAGWLKKAKTNSAHQKEQ